SAAAVREAYEETGLVVRAVRVLGVFDNRSAGYGHGALHVYHLMFECEQVGGELVTTTTETIDAGWFTEPEAGAWPLRGSRALMVHISFVRHATGDHAAFH